MRSACLPRRSTHVFASSTTTTRRTLTGETAMTRIRTLFLLLTVIGPMPMAEQMLTGIDEFYSIRALVARYHELFDPSMQDVASVLLITIVWTVVSILFCAMLWDQRPRLIVAGLFGLFGATEIHHVIES